MISVEFSHHQPLSPALLLGTVGVTQITNPMDYYILLVGAKEIIEAQVMEAAKKLNMMLQSSFERAMSLISEYKNFSLYTDVMKLVLSQSNNVGVEWTKSGIAKAKFVDLESLGSLADLKRFQRQAYPDSGTVEGWRGLYLAWRNRGHQEYPRVVKARLGFMADEKKAPFLELIEYGNPGGWPENAGHYIISVKFKQALYPQEMRVAYLQCGLLVRLLAAGSKFRIVAIGAATVTVDGVLYSGYQWETPRGEVIFIKEGTRRVVGGKLQGKGFVFTKFGRFIRKHSGYVI